MNGGTVEIIREECEEETDVDDRGSVNETEARGGWVDMGFLDKIDIDETDIDLDAKMGEGNKRKRG
jgi:hypothetical protein